MEEGEFTVARESLAKLECEYENLIYPEEPKPLPERKENDPFYNYYNPKNYYYSPLGHK